MRAGRLRHRITIEEPTESQGTDGGISTSWATFTQIWASKEEIRGSENFTVNQFFSEVVTKWRIRYRADITTKMRVSYDSKNYNIVEILDPDGRKRELHLLTEGVV